jgi:hypothetical protein
MQAILEQQRSNAIVPMSSDGGGSTQAPPIVVALIMALKELTSSVNTLTGAMYGQAKVIDSPTIKQLPEKNGGVIDVVPKEVKPEKNGGVIDVVPKEVKPASKEAELEYSRLLSKQMELLERIEENTRPKEIKAQKTEEQGGFGLGGLLSAIAIAAGTVAGLVSAWVKTVKFFVTGIGLAIEKTVVFLSRWFPSLRKILFNIEVTFTLLVESMKNIFKNAVGSVRNVFSNLAGNIANVFKGAIDYFKGILGEGSAIGKIITSIRTAVTNFITPIIEGFKVMTETSGPIAKFVGMIRSGITAVFEWFGGIGRFFAEMGSKLSVFGKLFGAVSAVVSKIAFPLMVIMAVWDTIKGAMKGWEEGGLVGAIGGAIKGLFSSLVGGVLDLIKGAISWIAGALGFDAVEKFLDSFSFSDLFGDLVDVIMFIPKQIQNFIMSPIETMKKLANILGELWEPVKEAMGTLFDAILWLPKQLFGLITDYVVDPLLNAFKPVTNFFKGLADKILSIFEDFGLPEIGFSVLGKKFSIGPWYPFRPEEGTVKVSGNEQMAQSSGNAGEVSNYSKNIVTSGTTGEVNRRTGKKESDETRVLTTTEKVGKDGKAVIKEDFATFDPKTGKAMLAGDAAGKDGSREISKRAFDQIKSAAQKGTDNDKIAEIVKEDDAYQKLSFFDRRKVDVGYAKASDLLAASKPTSADTLTKKSSETAAMKEAPTAPAGNTIVSAPTVNNTTKQTNVVRVPVRNSDNSVSSWLQSRYTG